MNRNLNVSCFQRAKFGISDEPTKFYRTKFKKPANLRIIIALLPNNVQKYANSFFNMHNFSHMYALS